MLNRSYRFIPFGLAAALLLSACGGSDGADDDAPMDDEAQWAEEEAAQDAREAWLLSDARPVNLACMEPSYSRGQPDTYIGLNAPFYPAVQAKSDALQQAMRDLRPKVVRGDATAIAENEIVAQKSSILMQFIFAAGLDLPSRNLLLLCNYEQYESDKCTRMARMLGDGFAVENVVKTDAALGFNTIQTDGNIRATVQLTNEDLDGMSINATENGVASIRGTWTRAADGTETVQGQHSANQTYTYTENPDCSGQARWTRPLDNGGEWRTDFHWTSARESDFTLTYRDCKDNDLGEAVCVEGGL